MSFTSSLLACTPQKYLDLWSRPAEGPCMISNGRSTFAINRIASSIWEQIDGSNTAEDILVCLGRLYGLPTGELQEDVLEILRKWHSENLIDLAYHKLHRFGRLNSNVRFDLGTVFTTRERVIRNLHVLIVVPPSPNFGNALPSLLGRVPLEGARALGDFEQHTIWRSGLLDLWSAYPTEDQLADLLREICPKVVYVACERENFRNGLRLAKFMRDVLDQSFYIIQGLPDPDLSQISWPEESSVDFVSVSLNLTGLRIMIARLLEGNSNVDGIPGVVPVADRARLVTPQPTLLAVVPSEAHFIEAEVRASSFLPVVSVIETCLDGTTKMFEPKELAANLQRQLSVFPMPCFAILEPLGADQAPWVRDFCDCLDGAGIRTTWAIHATLELFLGDPALAARIALARCKVVALLISTKQLEDSAFQRLQVLLDQFTKVGERIELQVMLGRDETPVSLAAHLAKLHTVQQEFNLFVHPHWPVQGGISFQTPGPSFECLYPEDPDQHYPLHPVMVAPGTDLHALRTVYYEGLKTLMTGQKESFGLVHGLPSEAHLACKQEILNGCLR